MTPDDDTSIADLELYGLSIRSIETLDRLGVLYIHQLTATVKQRLRDIPYIGALVLRELPVALPHRYRQRRAART
jgi:hypothetical protein